MKVINRQSQANDAAERWSEQYSDHCYEPMGVLVKLQQLGTNPSPDDVDEVTGNPSWTRVPDCDECGASDKEFVVMLGQEPDYDSRTAWICSDCLTKALVMVGRIGS